MALLCCTRKLLEKLPARAEATETEDVTAGKDDWYANLFRLDRRQAIIFTHAVSLYSFIIDRVQKKHFSQIIPLFQLGLLQRLKRDGFPHERNARLMDRVLDIRLAKTRSRSILGSMNDMVYCAKYMYELHKYEYEDIIDEVVRRINIMPMKAIGYKLPVEKFGEILT
jgi:hypothetical protein